MPGVVAERVEPAADAAADGDDQDVDAPAGIAGGELGLRIVVGHVYGEPRHLRLLGPADARGGLPQPVGVTGRDRYRGALSGEQPGGGQPDACGASHHQGLAAGQSEVHGESP